MSELDGFGFHSTTDDVLTGIDLSGRVAAVTGASGGLGLETARAMAAHGAHVVMAARDDAKLNAAVDSIRDAHPDASVDSVVIDLANIASCRRAAVEILTSNDRLDLLINNAGVMCTPFGHTSDGFETQFGTNHLGHMAWTLPLLDLLQRSSSDGSPSRIVNLSSAGHRFGGIDLDDPNFERREYDPWNAYGQSKTANVLFSLELDRRLAPVGVRSVAVHPGGIHTELGRHMTPALLEQIGKKIDESNPGGFDWKTIPQGAATTVWAATSAEISDREPGTGAYCEDCRIADDAVLPSAVDQDAATALWDLSMSMLTR